MRKPTIACPCVDCSSPVPLSTPCWLIFIKSISAASVAVVLRRSQPLSKSILIDQNWLSQTCIDPVQTHAQGPLKTHSPHNSLTNEVLPPLWRFIKEIIFDLFTIVQLLFSLKPIKVDVCYRVQALYETCHSAILVLPSEVREEVVSSDEDLLFALPYSESIFYRKLNSMHFTDLHFLALLHQVCVLHCKVVHVLCVWTWVHKWDSIGMYALEVMTLSCLQAEVNWFKAVL